MRRDLFGQADRLGFAGVEDQFERLGIGGRCGGHSHQPASSYSLAERLRSWPQSTRLKLCRHRGRHQDRTVETLKKREMADSRQPDERAGVGDDEGAHPPVSSSSASSSGE